MDNVLDFLKAKAKKLSADSSATDDINQLLNRIRLVPQEKQAFPGSSGLESVKEFQKKIEGRISNFLIEQGLVSSELLLCGIYISNMLSNFVTSSPESWCAFDYQCRNSVVPSPELLKSGGDTCFLICSVFPERGNWRTMKVGYYQQSGMDLYYQFYGQTGKTIGYWMSKNFMSMADVVSRCVHM